MNKIGRIVQCQTAIQQRDAATPAAQMDMDNIRHELRASQEQANFVRVEIQGSASHTSDLHHQLNRIQEMYHDLVVQENSRSNVMVSLLIGRHPSNR